MARTRKKIDWDVISKDMTPEGLQKSLLRNRTFDLCKDQYTATVHDDYFALALAIRDRLVEHWIKTQQSYHKNNVKRVYYLSLEFLMGRLLGTNIMNLGLWDVVQEALTDLDIDIDSLRDEESDAGLGNGGLGRLAACFLDSMATLGIPAHGYGIRYDYGIFHQKISNGFQVEFPDEWLSRGNPWEFARPEYAHKVHFYGRVEMRRDRNGELKVEWVDTDAVIAMPYDVPVPGYKSDVVNTLRLWSARSDTEFKLDYFNHGDYERAVYDKVFSENISKVLYPNDVMIQGKELRLKQEYFFTAASIADILRRYKVENHDLRLFPDKVAIQLNDTHPALAIPELLRVLIDEESLGWDTAWQIVVNTFAYTNHTVLPEALESWPVDLFERLFPRHMQIIYEINYRFLKEVAMLHPGDCARSQRMSIIEESNPKKVRMAYLSIIGSHSVNGVSELHSEIIKESLFKDFYEFCPEKFNNKTNGVTQRRWLQKSNLRLSDLITRTIGSEWITNFSHIKDIAPHAKNTAFQDEWAAIKAQNKKTLSDYIHTTMGIRTNPDSLFDVQVKRIHEYKRQLMFALYTIAEYLQVKSNPQYQGVPRTFIFGGKAAPGYSMAKLIIKFINNIADIVNNDKSTRDALQVVFLENYRVSLAEKIFPASDLSEQISTAGKEASGTGCMKFMINGALTIGTLDGANIEIVREVGAENAFMFGLDAATIVRMQREGYNPQSFIDRSPILSEVIHLIQNNFFSQGTPGLFDPIVQHLRHSDSYFICADFDDYFNTQLRVSAEYKDQRKWIEKSILNVALSGKFSSDRTIAEYNNDIWHAGGNIELMNNILSKTGK